MHTPTPRSDEVGGEPRGGQGQHGDKTAEGESDDRHKPAAGTPEPDHPCRLAHDRDRHRDQAEMAENEIDPAPVCSGNHDDQESAEKSRASTQRGRERQGRQAPICRAQNPRPISAFGSQVAIPGKMQSSTMKPSISSTKGKLPQRISDSGTCGATPRRT